MLLSLSLLPGLGGLISYRIGSSKSSSVPVAIQSTGRIRAGEKCTLSSILNLVQYVVRSSNDARIFIIRRPEIT